MRVTFCFPAPDLPRLAALDPDRDWTRFQHGEEAWILATYLRLKAAGAAVELAATPPDEGLVVLHGKHKRRLAGEIARLRRARVAMVRGDLGGSLAAADFEIVQNGSSADSRRRFHLPHWPQPGLQPRDERRGDRLERVVFKGFLANLHPELRDASWAELLAARGLVWDVDAVRFSNEEASRALLRWPDFREVDAVLAVRPPGGDVARKPAAKLYNAWLAGVPALLGPEPAYRECRRSELDYLEVEGREAARAAVDRLLGEPGLYRAMIDNGRSRAGEVSVAATTAAWRELLERTLPAAIAAESGPGPKGGDPGAPPLARRLLRYVDRLRFAVERPALKKR